MTAARAARPRCWTPETMTAALAICSASRCWSVTVCAVPPGPQSPSVVVSAAAAMAGMPTKNSATTSSTAAAQPSALPIAVRPQANASLVKVRASSRGCRVEDTLYFRSPTIHRARPRAAIPQPVTMSWAIGDSPRRSPSSSPTAWS